MKLQYISLKRIPSQKLQESRVAFGQVSARVTNHKPSKQGNDENVRVKGVVNSFFTDVSESIVPEADKSNPKESLGPGNSRFMIVSECPRHVLGCFLHKSSTNNSEPCTVLISLEAEVHFV